jgi:hypothetical protein
LTEEFRELQAEKSHLLLEARVLQARRDPQAPARFAEVARLEEDLAARAQQQPDLLPYYRRHAFSAATCWAAAGHLERSLAWCEELLEEADTPELFHREVADFAARLRRQQAAAPSPPPEVAVPPRERATVLAPSRS